MRFQFVSLVILSVALGTQGYASSGQKPFSYRVEVPAAGPSCDVQAKNIGDTLSQSTGVTLTKLICQGASTLVDQGQTFYKNIIQVNYLAEKELAPVRSIFSAREFLGRPLDGSGMFLKYSDCLQALGDQSKNFEKETGVNVVAGYCQASYDSFNPGFSLTIEGFGTPARQLFLSSNDEDIYYSSPQTLSTISDAIKSTIVGAGGHIVLSDMHHVFYYNDQLIYVTTENLGAFSDPSQCENQKTDALNLFTKGHLINPTVFCADNNTLMVIAGGLNTISEDFGGQSPRYASFSNCMDDRERMIQNMSSQGFNVLGAICKPNRNSNDEFAVTLFFGSN